MKNILMIGTGGTIASEMTPSGLTPELNSTQLLSFVPRIGEMCHVDCVQLYSLDSTNIRPIGWVWPGPCGRITIDMTALSSPTAPTPWPIPPLRLAI